MQMPQMAKDVFIEGVIALPPAAVKPQSQGKTRIAGQKGVGVWLKPLIRQLTVIHFLHIRYFNERSGNRSGKS
jgi:hypothetical protein